MKKLKFVLLSVILFCAVQLNAQTGYLPFTESFENGIQKWTNTSTGGTVGVTTAESIVGSNSFHMTGTAAAGRLTNNFSNAIAVNEIMYYVRVASANGGILSIGDGTNILFYGNVNGGNFVVQDINGAYALCPVNTNEWMKVEVKNINYTTYTYEVWINDTLRRSDLEFNSSISSVSKIDLYNNSTTDEAWWDAIYLGIVDYEKPSYTGDKVCQDDTASVVFSKDVAFDSLGINVLGTNFNIGPITADTTIHYTHPYFETTMDDDNANGLSWSGNMFDITAHDKDIVINAIDVRDNEITGPDAVKIYYRKGTYVGNNLSNAGWLLHDSVAVPLNGHGIATYVQLTKGLVIPKGETYGIYVCVGKGVEYTNGTASNQLIVGEDITFSGGHGGPYFNLSISPRVWNGRIYYQVVEEQVDTATLETPHNGGTFMASAGSGCMFDLYAKNDVILDSLDVRSYSSGNGWCKIYYRNGTYVGNTTSEVGWALLDSVNVDFTTSLTRVALNNKLLIPADSTYGIYICTQNGARYLNSGPTTYLDSNLVLISGAAGSFYSCTYTPRTFSGTMYYTVRNNEVAEVGPQTSSYTGNVRGYLFEAPKDFIIKGVMIPNDVTGNQCIEVVRFNSLTVPGWDPNDDFVSLGYWKNIPQGVVIPCDIFVNKGDTIGVYGKGGSITSYNSTTTTMDILGNTTTIYRSGMQYDLLNEQMKEIFWSDVFFDMGRVNLFIEDVSKHGGKDSLLLEVQNPVVYLGTDTSICADETITLDAGLFSTYNWSTAGFSQTEDIDSVGTGLGSTDVWVVVEDQYGCEASDTITITFVDCTGIEEETLSLSVYPNPSKDVFFVNAQGLNEEMHIEVMNIEGRLIKQLTTSAITTKIDLSDQQPGVYFIRLRIGTQTQVVNVVLQ